MADDEAYWQSQHLLANEEGGPVTAVSTTRNSGFPVVTGPDGEVVTEEALRLIWQERWRGAFDQADENGDGRIDRRELGKALIIAGMNPRSALFDQILDGMGGAELDFGEFARLAEDARAAGGGAGGGGATWEALSSAWRCEARRGALAASAGSRCHPPSFLARRALLSLARAGGGCSAPGSHPRSTLAGMHERARPPAGSRLSVCGASRLSSPAGAQ